MRVRPGRVYSVGIFLGACVIYGLTCCRTVFVGDAGELTLALTTAGIAHPPGYPLYTILGYLWLKLFFFLRPALAANLFSSAAAAGSAVVIFWLLEAIGRSRLPRPVAAGLAGAFAGAYPVWSSATNAEVYALSALLYSAALYAVAVFFMHGGRRPALAAFFLSGLVLSHHFSAGVVIAALVLVMIFRRHEATASLLVPAVILFILPLSLYLYLYLRFNPSLPVNWMTGRSLSAVWGMVSGETYRQFVGLPTAADLFVFARKTGAASLMYFGPAIILMALPGLLMAVKENARMAVVFLVPAGLNLLLIATCHVPDYHGYVIPSLVSAVVFISVFLAWLLSRIRRGGVVTVVTAALLVVIPLTANYARCDISDFSLARQYGMDLLDSAPDGARLFLKSDNGSHTALYLHYVEGYRPDLEVFSINSTLTRLRHRFSGPDYETIVNSLESTGGNVYWGTEYVVNQGMNPSPSPKSVRGLLYGPAGGADDPEMQQRIARFTQTVLPDIDLKNDLKAKQIALEYRLHEIDRLIGGQSPALSAALMNLARWGESLGDPMTCLAVAQFFTGRGLTDHSIKWVDLAMRADPVSYEQLDLYVNLGTIYRQAGDLGKARQALNMALRIDSDYAPARYNSNLVRAEEALQRQDWPAALDAFFTLTRIEPDNPLPYFNIAVVYEHLDGHTEDAIQYYRTFISMAGGGYARTAARARERVDSLQSRIAAPE